MSVNTTSVPVRVTNVDERMERLPLWPGGFKWCCWGTSPDLPRSTVVTNAYTRKRARRKFRSLWLDHVRFMTDDQESTVVAMYRPVCETS